MAQLESARRPPPLFRHARCARANAGRFGSLVCGRVNAHFSLFQTAPPGTIHADSNALVAATHAQLKAVMSEVGVALSQDGACQSNVQVHLKLDPIASAAPYALLVG